MADQANSRAERQPGDAVGENQFAVSEHAFLERLNAQESSETRERLDEMGEALGSDIVHVQSSEGTASGVMGELEAFVRRQPLSALLGALVAGIALGMIARR